jgi:hypothetical protein
MPINIDRINNAKSMTIGSTAIATASAAAA